MHFNQVMNYKNWAGVTFILVLIIAVISSIQAIHALAGNPYEIVIQGLKFFNDIRISIDALSAWFILIINFTMITATLYSVGYMSNYKERGSELVFHWITLLLFHLSMIAVCCIQNGMAFLVAWEVMSLTSFFLVIFENEKTETIKAGLNYLIQMHISMILLTIGVIWLSLQTGSFDFKGISNLSPAGSYPLFLLFFIGFAFKAGFNLGFIPLHTWLPRAHPAAPSHISAIMSGVMIKIGIFGILRVIQLIAFGNSNTYLLIGWGIMAISVISGLYGVMLAIIQHNLKRLLAYHSIENIGIIGIGIGLGCLGIGYENNFLAIMGFAGALLHSLNHSLFKSLLFLAAGNIYTATHTMNIESFGGLVKKMPQTSFLFLLAALAICGLPPFNGFVSEFILYSGLYQGIIRLSPVAAVIMVLVVLGLALIGGLALLCFTKAFGIVFLGEERVKITPSPHEAPAVQLIPMYLTGAVILAIGLFPVYFFRMMNAVVSSFLPFDVIPYDLAGSTIEILQQAGRAALIFTGISGAILGIRYLAQRRRGKMHSATWGCGYVAPSPRMQYTANSYVRIYRKLAGSFLLIEQNQTELKEIFPEKQEHFNTQPGDRFEKYLIDVPIKLLDKFLGLFRFIQNGKIQYYLLYGLIFLMIVMLTSLLPLLFILKK